MKKLSEYVFIGAGLEQATVFIFILLSLTVFPMDLGFIYMFVWLMGNKYTLDRGILIYFIFIFVEKVLL